MKKALKILLWTIVSILALVLVLVLTIPLWLGSTVTAVANKVAPEYTGTPFTLDGVGINPYTGKYRVTKLNLGNPQGYPVPTAFSVSNVYVDVEMSSLFSDTIHIREITINDTYVSYVSNEGTNNFEWIGAHVQEKLGPQEEKAEPKEEKEEKGAGKKVVIDKLTIAGTRVKVKILPEMPIPTITLTDIGKDKGGATWEEIGKTITDAIMKALSSIGDGLTSALGVLGDGASSVMGGATNLLGNAANALGGATTNVLGGATKALGGAADVVSGAATNVLGGATKALGSLGGLLGGGDEKKDDGKASEAKSAADNAAKDAESEAKAKASEAKAKASEAEAKVSEAKDAGKSVGEGAVNAGKAIGEGAVNTGKAIGDGLKKLNPFGK